MKRQPSLIIAGVFKAATTSFYTYLSYHTEICQSNIKEIGFFVPLRYDLEVEELYNYYDYFDCNEQTKYLLEASPGYLYGGKKIANFIHDRLVAPKIILILREPLERLYSFYKFLQTKYLISHPTTLFDANVSFYEYFKLSRDYFLSGQRLSEKEEYLLNGVHDSIYALYLDDWKQLFPDSLKVLFFEEIKENPEKEVHAVLDWLNLRKDNFRLKEFTVENKTTNHNFRLLHNLALSVNDTFEPFLRKNHKVKAAIRNVYYSFNGKSVNTSFEELLSPQERKEIELFFKPYNEQLKTQLIQLNSTNLPVWLK